MSTYQSYAEYYHDLTKYTPEGVSSNPQRIDFSTQPAPFKEYPNKKNIDISYLLPLDRNPFSDVGIKNPEEYTSTEKSLSKISRLFFLSNGITAIIPYVERPFYMRAAPSAGGLYPTEIYLVTFNYFGLEDGIYNYQTLDHSLSKIVDGNFKNQVFNATFENPAIEKSKAVLILTGVFYRSSWRYQDRAYRRICLDTGHVIGNLNVVSNFCGFKAHCIGGFVDKKINELLNLNDDEEGALAVIGLSDRDENIKIDFASALPSDLNNTNIKTPEGQRLIELHTRSSIENHIKVPNIKFEDLEEKFKFSPAIKLNVEKNDLVWKGNLIQTILERRSTRILTSEPITKGELSNILDFAYHPEFFSQEGLDPNPSYFDTSIIDTFVAVNSVDGLEEGCYFYLPSERHLRQVRFKNFRDDIYYLCLGQELGYKASAVVFHTCDLSRAVFKYGERAYRYIHLDAGQLGQRINLAAVNLKLGVSGIGGFFDDEVNEMLGIPEQAVVVYITVLGVPATNTEE